MDLFIMCLGVAMFTSGLVLQFLEKRIIKVTEENISLRNTLAYMKTPATRSRDILSDYNLNYDLNKDDGYAHSYIVKPGEKRVFNVDDNGDSELSDDIVEYLNQFKENLKKIPKNNV